MRTDQSTVDTGPSMHLWQAQTVHRRHTLWGAFWLTCLLAPCVEAHAESFSFVLRLSDPGGLLGGAQPKITLESSEAQQTVEPLDNGARPDVQAGDGVYSIGVANWSSKALSITVFTDAGGEKVFGKTPYTFESDSEHNVSVMLSDTGIRAGAQDPGPAAASAPEGAAPPSDGPEPGPITQPAAVDALLEPVAELPWRPFVVALGIGVLGWAFFRRVFQRHGAAVMRIGLGKAVRPLDPELPGVAQTPVLFSVPAPHQTALVRTLLWNLLDHCDVLLIPIPAHRAAWLSEFEPTLRGIWMLDAERPAPKQILQTAHELEALGKPVCIVLEGLEGLQGWKNTRPHRPLQRLLTMGGVPILIVVESSLEPTERPDSMPPLTLCRVVSTSQENLLQVDNIWLEAAEGRLRRRAPPEASEQHERVVPVVEASH